jgi:hypothetical protein
MIFQDPDTLQLWINVFFAVAAASVAFAFVALTVGVRQLRRPLMAAPALAPQGAEVASQPTRRAA